MLDKQTVTSADNRQVKEVRDLHQRKYRIERHEALVEGVRMLEEVLAAGVPLRKLVYSESFGLSPAGREFFLRLAPNADSVLLVSDEVFAKLATTETPQGVMAVTRAPGGAIDEVLSAASPLLVMVDRVQDPGNLGTIVRTAAGAGATGVLLGTGTVELSSPKVLRATMGAAFRIPVAVHVDLRTEIEALARRGVRTVAGDPRGTLDYFSADLKPPLAILVGNEANGPSAELMSLVAQKVRIPMTDKVESLNVGVASGLLLYESLRQLRG